MKFESFETALFEAAVDTQSGTWLLLRKCDNATTLRFTNTEGQQTYKTLKRLWRKSHDDFDAYCIKHETFTEGDPVWWRSSSGEIELAITLEQAEACHHPGPCDADVIILADIPEIRQQLDAIDSDTLKTELDEYGAWDDAELSDHEQNLQRLLWLACIDLCEEHAASLYN